jgi:hypothetical protein
MDENAVVAALCPYLEKNGYEVVQRLHTTQQGVDIIARHSSGREMFVEAKGATSSREGSARFGRGFSGTQVFDRVAKGVFTALQLRATYRDRTSYEVALAVPDTPGFRKYLKPVLRELTSAGLRIFLVGPELEVEELQHTTTE